MLKGITIRLHEDDIEKIRNVAVEGNVSQWIRLLIEKELAKMDIRLFFTTQKEKPPIARGNS